MAHILTFTLTTPMGTSRGLTPTPTLTVTVTVTLALALALEDRGDAQAHLEHLLELLFLLVLLLEGRGQQVGEEPDSG